MPNVAPLTPTYAVARLVKGFEFVQLVPPPVVLPTSQYVVLAARVNGEPLRVERVRDVVSPIAGRIGERDQVGARRVGSRIALQCEDCVAIRVTAKCKLDVRKRESSASHLKGSGNPRICTYVLRATIPGRQIPDDHTRPADGEAQPKEDEGQGWSTATASPALLRYVAISWSSLHFLSSISTRFWCPWAHARKGVTYTGLVGEPKSNCHR